MNMVFLGPPGAGKGTQARKIKDRHGYPQISTGDILRDALKNGTDRGLKAKEYMDAGKLVPDEVVVGIVAERLRERDCKGGFILDGFPRTAAQAEALGKILAGMGRRIDMVIDFSVGEEELIKRIVGRRICKNCRMGYNIWFAPPAKEGVCDVCGGELQRREDDSEQTARARFKVYKEQSEELGAYYDASGKYRKMDGAAGVEEIFEKIEEIIGKK